MIKNTVNEELKIFRNVLGTQELQYAIQELEINGRSSQVLCTVDMDASRTPIRTQEYPSKQGQVESGNGENLESTVKITKGYCR